VTQLRSHDPVTLLQHARDRYDDALNLACENAVGTETAQRIHEHIENLAPGITDQPAWPTLRQQLIHAAADNHDPIALIDNAASRGRLDNARDPAATLTWRLRDHDIDLDLDLDLGRHGQLPALIRQNLPWSNYLQHRQDAVLAARRQLKETTSTEDADDVTGRLARSTPRPPAQQPGFSLTSRRPGRAPRP